MKLSRMLHVVLFGSLLIANGGCAWEEDVQDEAVDELVTGLSNANGDEEVTAVTATSLKTGAQDASTLPSTEVCKVPSGTKVMLRNPTSVGVHVTGLLRSAHGCGGKFGGGARVYVFRAHFSGWSAGSGAPASSTGVSARGQDQMNRLVSHADRNHGGASRGRCFEYVWRYLSSSGYGNIDEYGDAADMPSAYARNFAEYMNKPANAERWGLRRLSLTNPYDAPRGAVVVVAAGSPGTAHPTAGDISVAAGNGRFINDGPNMGYGGSAAAFTRGGGRVLGIFVPR